MTPYISRAVPRISVLMTTYNGAATVKASIACVLAQDCTDVELVIVDDASTDDTAAIIRNIIDPRINFIAAPINEGVVGARNRAFAAARGAYIAALDQDDLCTPDRLRLQADYLDTHADIVLVATEIAISRNGHITPPDHPIASEPSALRFLLHIDNPLTWSSVMFRADAIRQLGQFMRPDYALSDDFDLYHRLLGLGDIARLKQVLTTYVYHTTNLSLARGDVLAATSTRVLADAYAPWFGDGAARAAALVTRHLCERQPVTDGATLDELGRILARLTDIFCAPHAAGTQEHQRIVTLAEEAWRRTMRASIRSGSPWLIRHYRCAGLGSARTIKLGSSIAVGMARAAMKRARHVS